MIDRYNIVNIRGTSGSGKTTLVRALWDSAERVTPDHATMNGGTAKAPQNYLLSRVEGMRDPFLWVLGKYETACGGCDTIKTQDDICQRVRFFHSMGPVLFEGLLISHLFSRYRDLAHELGGIRFLFLDTPEEVCVERVKQRREERARRLGKPAKPLNETNTRQKWHDMRRVFEKMEVAGLHPEWIDGQNLANGKAQVLYALNEDR